MIYPQSSKKLIIVSVLSILVLSFITFGTLAYFRQTDTASAIIGVGSNISITTNDKTVVTITDMTPGSKAVGSTVKKTAGVKAKLRVYVNVSLVDEATGNTLESVTDGSGNAYFTVNMNSIDNAQWVKDAGVVTDSPIDKTGAYWRYLMKSSNASEAFELATNTEYTICSSVTVNNNYNLTGYKLIVTTSVEVLQYNNVDWNGNAI